MIYYTVAVIVVMETSNQITSLQAVGNKQAMGQTSVGLRHWHMACDVKVSQSLHRQAEIFKELLQKP